MLPSLREGHVLELAAFDRTRVGIGEIVVFRSGERLLAHRVIVLSSDGSIITSGDARPWACERVAPIDVIGTVTAVFENDAPSARRIDDAAFARSGRLFARTRWIRAVIARPRLLAKTIVGALPWRRERSFEIVHHILRSYLQDDVASSARSFARVLARGDGATLAEFARRHACSALIGRALAFARSGSDPAVAKMLGSQRFIEALQIDARLGALRNVALTAQTASIATLLGDVDVPFALLKGSARLAAAGPDAALCASRDIDVYVPADAIDTAIATLLAAGYYFKADATERLRYRERVHHAAPLYPPGDRGWIVELHTRLARPAWLSTPTHWEALETHLVWVDGPCGRVRVFDRFGTVLHHLIHGIGLSRYRDVFVAARAMLELTDGDRGEIARIVRAETGDPIRLAASYAVVADVAGRHYAPTREVAAYLAWVRKREALPRSLRRGAYALEAWFASGGRPRAIVSRILGDEGSLTRDFARLLLAPVTGLYTLAMRA